MRPLELTMEGFKSYRERQTFEFDARTLFGIVGPTGAGKSSLLEAMIFGLFGKTPRVERDTKKLIHTACEDLKVRIVFEVDDASWEATRVARRKGAPQVVLKKVADGSTEATGEKAVNARVEELLGLDFKAFCSSVVLPQGEFDRFLNATPGDRSKILKGIFRLERVDLLREIAKSKASNIGGRMSALQAEQETLPADAAAIDLLQHDLADLEIQAQEIRKSLESASRAEADLGRTESRLSQIDERLQEATRVISKIPKVPELEELQALEEQARRAEQQANAALAGALAEIEKAEEHLLTLREQFGGQEVIARAKELSWELTKLVNQEAELRAESTKCQQSLEQSSVEIEKRSAPVKAADEEVTRARKDLDELRRRHAAHLLRLEIEEGQPCPVCEQDVAKVPATKAVPALDQAEQSVADAETKLVQARKQLDAAVLEQAKCSERLESSEKRIAQWDAAVAEAKSALTELVGDVDDPVAEVRSRERALEAAAGGLESARTSASKQQNAARVAGEKVASVSGVKRQRAASLIEICGWLKLPAPPVDGDTADLLDAAKRSADAGLAILESSQREKEGLGTAKEKLEKQIEEFRERFDLPQDAPITNALERTMGKAGEVRAQLETVKKGFERATQIRTELEELSRQKELFTRLSLDLTDSRFTAYLLDGRRRLLSRLGSEKLFELTGRYRFDDEGDFLVVDAATGKSRTPDTLSGGETFLASLALALALAEAVSQQGGRLGCFFLDEGFGSLDPESLDLALEGIEALAVPGRMIGLISHVGGIQARLDDLIVLDKNEDGSTEVIQSEGPITYGAASI